MTAKASCPRCKESFEFAPNPRQLESHNPYEVNCPKCRHKFFARLD